MIKRIAVVLLLSIICLSSIFAQEPLTDSEYFSFGDIFKVEKPEKLDNTNPHQIAQYSVYLCKQGLTDKMVGEIGHIEKDDDLGEAFVTFLREFGPDLERFKEGDLFLKFYGYKAGKDTSVWYYYLIDVKGIEINRKPWISLHRSNNDGRCALTGIFLNLSNDEKVPIPDDLKTTK